MCREPLWERAGRRSDARDCITAIIQTHRGVRIASKLAPTLDLLWREETGESEQFQRFFV